jgi:mono/diheme cytochrome c family protein
VNVRWTWWLFGGLLLSGWALCGVAQEPLLATRRSGLIQHTRVVDSEPVTPTSRNVPRPLLFALPQNVDTETSLLSSASSLHAVWTGQLEAVHEGEYQLAAVHHGRLRLQFGDRLVLVAEPVQIANKGGGRELNWSESKPWSFTPGWHPMQLEYEGSLSDAQLTLFWRGPGFDWEVIPQRHFANESSSTGEVEHGRELYHSLRCDACHTLFPQHDAVAATQRGIPAPSLQRLSGNLQRPWLIEWLTGPSSPPGTGTPRNRVMPHFSLDTESAHAIADYLQLTSIEPRQSAGTRDNDAAKRSQGEQLVHQRGCLGCHSVDHVGNTNSDGGGDLSAIGAKRTADFVRQYLTDPASVNPHHRMPVFIWKTNELESVSAYLLSLGVDSSPANASTHDSGSTIDRAARGKELFRQYACHACHEGPQDASAESESRPNIPLGHDGPIHGGCIASDAPSSASTLPHYRSLSAEQRRSLLAFLSQKPIGSPDITFVTQPLAPLAQWHCTACHERGELPGVRSHLESILMRVPKLAEHPDSLLPPTLNAVGDKLHRQTIVQVIGGELSARRPWLNVQMPRFPMVPEQMVQLADRLIAADRVPSQSLRSARSFSWEMLRDDQAARTANPASEVSQVDVSERLAARQLVTSEGFGCVSCHAIGAGQAIKAAPGTRGPDLRLIGQHVRHTWFDRFLRNPARTSSRLEMPSIQTPVRGVLDDDLHRQLDALWNAMNDPTFDPPRADPVRVVYQTGQDGEASPLVVSDVVRAGSATYLKPLLVGLSNRHNVLWDLASARLAEWSVGDTASQHTEGKSWYWQSMGEQLLRTDSASSDWTVLFRGATRLVRPDGQFVTEMDWARFDHQRFLWSYRLQWDDTEEALQIHEAIQPWQSEGASGLERQITVTAESTAEAVRMRVVDAKDRAWTLSRDGRRLEQTHAPFAVIELISGQGRMESADGSFQWTAATARPDKANATVSLRYYVPWQPAGHAARPRNEVTNDLRRVDTVPGFVGTRLPLTEQIMPTALTWGPDDELYVASLKGRVWRVTDTDGDQCEDLPKSISPELAAPYGLIAGPQYVDVIAKDAILRLHDDDLDGHFESISTLASGWGHTDDYHDWAVGLCRDDQGNYYCTLPCQQDDRSEAAAKWRGTTLQLAPRAPTKSNPHRFTIKPISTGHRFPMGIARNREGLLVVTDNQGNYNPFNELNVVEPNRHFGFINRIDRARPEPQEVTEPAIAIPHPWTRSVNGICFLETPVNAANMGQGFGPFEGHLVGCEYDTRRLIRMTLQRVADGWHGAAYPMSVEADETQRHGFLGPICCAVSPDGTLYVGSIRDSGWGGANNVGEIVRLELDADTVPCGIREVTVTDDGFQIAFTSAVDPTLARVPSRYEIASYFRQRTPAYGGEDIDRRSELVQEVELNEDRTAAHLKLQRVENGRVYELKLQRMVAEPNKFFPSEAYFTN